jgi:hypothetical protein
VASIPSAGGVVGSGSFLDHDASAREVYAVFDHHPAARQVSVHARPGHEKDAALGLQAALHLSLDVGVADLHIYANTAVRSDLQTVAIEQIAIELTLDAQRSFHHQSSAEARPDTDDRVRSLFLGGSLFFLAQELHRGPPGSCHASLGG